MRIALALVALVTAAAPVVAEASAPSPGPRVTLRWVDVHGSLAPPEFDAMAKDVSSLFRKIGLNVAWARAEPGEGFEGDDVTEIPVIALRSSSTRSDPEHVLGLVARDHAPPSPIWIFINELRWALGHTGSAPTEHERRELAVAVGHVIAHELSHALAPRQAHAASGLMGPSLGRDRLLAPGATLDQEWVRSVRSGLAVLAKGGARVVDVAKAGPGMLEYVNCFSPREARGPTSSTCPGP